MSQELFIRHIDAQKKKMVFHWEDDIQSSGSYLFLRDNCDSLQSRHPNGQRLIDPLDIPDDIYPLSWNLAENRTKLFICWNHDNHTSEYSSRWLRAHTLPNADHQFEMDDSILLWNQSISSQLPEKDFLLIQDSKDEFAGWLTSFKQLGFGILHKIPLIPNFVLEFIRLFGFVRETNYGKVFDVKAKINPNNLAYTNVAIRLHTDNPYRHPVPTIQVLHCLESNATGGDSILADGFAIAEK
jgi:gamma-butyrobetaine dioxygenase